jgi:hypothetical protein
MRALAENREILGVSMDLGPVSSWPRTAALGPNGESWAEITISDPRLQIDQSAGGWSLVSNELLTFQFAPQTPAPEAKNTDTLWTMVRWYESAP